MLRYTLELSGTADGKGTSRAVMTCDVDLPRLEADTCVSEPEDDDMWYKSGSKQSAWDEWWCVEGNPNPILTETTCIDGTSNTKLQSKAVLGSLSFAMHSAGLAKQRRGSAVFGGSLRGLQGGQVCINIGKVHGAHSRPASTSTGAYEEEEDMDRATAEGWEQEDDDAPTPFFLHIGAVTVDRALMERTLGTPEAFHNYRRSASLEHSMSWRRGTNASIRLVIDPHFPGLPQALYIPVEPLEGAEDKYTDRAVLVPEYVRRAEERYISAHSPIEGKVHLEEAERASPAFIEFMVAEHEKQQWKVPINKAFGELKFTATLQIQGSGGGGQHQAVQVPLMSQGVRYLDMQACYKAMTVYAHRVSTRAQAVQEDSIGPKIRQPTVRVSLLSLKHSFGGEDGSDSIASSNRAEIVLVGNVLQFARSDLLSGLATSL